jgi:CRISPR/Cas system Type II protein with McrA/HNH and RuvC-like nuclease domain
MARYRDRFTVSNIEADANGFKTKNTFAMNRRLKRVCRRYERRNSLVTTAT